MSALLAFDQHVASLDAAQLATLARRYQTLAKQEGAHVTLADGAKVAIPTILSPVVLPEAERAALSADAGLLLSAISRIAGAVIRGPATPLRALLFDPLSPFERDAMERTHARAERLATARVDFLVGIDGVARALEVNTTIPAMQGYSDAIAAAFLRALGEQRGASDAQIEGAIAHNGRNTDELLAALIEHHAAATGKPAGEPRSIAIVARPGDAQGGELDHYARRWRALGHDAFRVTPDEIELEGTRGRVGARVPDLFYRHVFLRRLAHDGAFARLLLSEPSPPIWNPPASHLELKGLLGVTSEIAIDDEAAARHALRDDERAAIERRLPWTRVLRSGPTRGPAGERIDDLTSFVRASPAELVLKRSWDYGGRGVFLGAELADPIAQGRLRELLGTGGDGHGWEELVDHVERSGEAWVVQTLIDVAPRKLLRVEDAGPTTRSLYTDLSAFTSLGGGVAPTGGAVRASSGRIVNIQGGGGLAPLVREAALARLLA